MERCCCSREVRGESLSTDVISFRAAIVAMSAGFVVATAAFLPLAGRR